jgi:hypothetical protein
MSDDSKQISIEGNRGKPTGSGSICVQALFGDTHIELIVSAAVLDTLHINAGGEWPDAACAAIEEAATRKLSATNEHAGSLAIDVADLRTG